MKLKHLILAGLVLLVALVAWNYLAKDDTKTSEQAEETGQEHNGEDEHGHEEEGEHTEGRTEISEEAAQAAGVKLEQASSGKVAEFIALNGRLNFHPNYMARLQARYPGIVRSLKVNVGDKVEAGQVLATVESNDSLNTYPLKSPIKGSVMQRNVSVGENTTDEPVLVVADPTQFWFTLYVFPTDVAKVSIGQKVIITSLDGQHSTETKVTGILPDSASDTPISLVQGKLDNISEVWVAGAAVTGKVVIKEQEASLVVKVSALQTYEGKDVVFVKDGHGYEARPVILGLNDGTYAEVKAGLKEGEAYVIENSYLIKADIEKAGASHEH